jgi:hypothetical protein
LCVTALDSAFFEYTAGSAVAYRSTKSQRKAGKGRYREKNYKVITHFPSPMVRALA